MGLFKKMDIGYLEIKDYLGAIFSATDSVCTLQVLNQDKTPLLYNLVFGEGVVNDTTSVVLFNALQNFDLVHIDIVNVLKFVGNFIYLFATSTFLGAFAVLCVIIASFDILTVFFCGIEMSHYTWHNVTESSRVTTNPGKSIAVTIWWAGLMRGTVSIALAYKQAIYNMFKSSAHTQLRGNVMMITSTITVALFSTMVFGLMTKHLIKLLLPPSMRHFNSMSEPPSPKSFTPPLGNVQGSKVEAVGHNIPRPTSLPMLLCKPTHTVHHYWLKFDDSFMRPVFGVRGFVPYVPGSPTE